MAHQAGESHTDRPGRASPPIRDFVIVVDNGMPREAEWYWGQALGLLDRLSDVGVQARQGAAGVPAARPEPWLEANS